MTRASGFDRVARAYRWLEYLCFGPQLQRCRLQLLTCMSGAERCLVVGDGDGRFTAALLAANSRVQVVAVDSSEGMLALLSARVRRAGGSTRLTVIDGDAVRLLADGGGDPALRPAAGFDLVCTHFFLDCLSSEEVCRLVDGVRTRLVPGGCWVVSEFATPSLWARLVVALLYAAFALLAGLKARQLPLWREALVERGFACIHERQMLRGLLTSTLWRLAHAPPLKQPRANL